MYVHAVALASVYVGRPVVGSVGVLGKISLSGGMTAVSDLTRKIMAMEQAAEGYRRAAHPVPGSEQQPTAPLVVVVPTDSVYGKMSRLLESSTGAKVQLPRRLIKKLRVVAVDSMFACLRLLLPPPVAVEQGQNTDGSKGRRDARWLSGWLSDTGSLTQAGPQRSPSSSNTSPHVHNLLSLAHV